jgi:hypothetical protein
VQLGQRDTLHGTAATGVGIQGWSPQHDLPQVVDRSPLPAFETCALTRFHRAPRVRCCPYCHAAQVGHEVFGAHGCGAVSGIPGYLQQKQGGIALFGASNPLEIGGIELRNKKLKRVIDIILPICMAPDCGEVSIGSTVAGGQQQASVAVFAESIDNGLYRGEEHYTFANDGSALCGKAVMIDTMEGKITPLCAEIRGVKGYKVQVRSIQSQVVAGVRVQSFRSQELFAPKHVVSMHKAVEFRLWFPVKLGWGTGKM